MLKQKQSQKQTQKQKQSKTIAEQVDEAFENDQKVKQLSDLVKKTKETLKNYARGEELHELKGEKAKIVFSQDVITKVDPYTLYNHLKEEGRENEFFDLVKVNVGDARKKLGDNELEKVAEVSVKDYAKGTLKEKKE